MSSYTITRANLDGITGLEIAFGTTKLLPPYEEVPDEFKHGNTYTELVSALFVGQPLPDLEITFREGFTDEQCPEQLNRAVHAHLHSFQPKHEHKIAGVAYLVSQVCLLQAADPEG